MLIQSADHDLRISSEASSVLEVESRIKLKTPCSELYWHNKDVWIGFSDVRAFELKMIWRKWRFGSSKVEVLGDLARAQALIEALDRGGVVSDPVRVNAIARSLGLEVSKQAPLEQTIKRIRAAVLRAESTNR